MSQPSQYLTQLVQGFALNSRALPLHKVTLMLFLAFSLALVPLFAATSQALAEEEAPWVSWHLTFDFTSGNPAEAVTLTALTGKKPTALYEPIILKAEKVSINCTIVGSIVPTADDYVYFDGSSFIACEMPEMQSTWEKMAPLMTVTDGCECDPGGSPFYTSADVRNISDTSGVPQPLWSMVYSTGGDLEWGDMALSLVPSGENELSHQLQIGTETVTSEERWPQDPNGNRIWLGNGGMFALNVMSERPTTDLPGLWNLAVPYLSDEATAPIISEWAEDSGGAPSWEPFEPRPLYSGEYGMKTVGGAFYIGYNPSTGKFLQGEVRIGDVEPGCRGR